MVLPRKLLGGLSDRVLVVGRLLVLRRGGGSPLRGPGAWERSPTAIAPFEAVMLVHGGRVAMRSGQVWAVMEAQKGRDADR